MEPALAITMCAFGVLMFAFILLLMAHRRQVETIGALERALASEIERREELLARIRRLYADLSESRHDALLYGSQDEAKLAEWTMDKLKEMED